MTKVNSSWTGKILDVIMKAISEYVEEFPFDVIKEGCEISEGAHERRTKTMDWNDKSEGGLKNIIKRSKSQLA